MKKNKNDVITDKISFFIQKIENNGKFTMFLVGLLLLAFSCIFKDEQNKKTNLFFEVMGQTGGIFVSAAGVAFFYDKYRDQKQVVLIEESIKKHQNLLVDERDNVMKEWTLQNKQQTTNYIKLLSRGLQEKIYVECIDKEFIDIIPREELDKNDDYRFEVMTMKMAQQNEELKQNNPVLIYGSTLGIFDWIDEEKKERNKVNKQALIEAIRNGVHFKLALNTIESINTNNVQKDTEKKNTIANVVSGVKNIIEDEELSSATGSIDLRYIPTVERNSFSSFVCDGRRVSVLDFNFENSSKLSQIFDEKVTAQNESQNLASLLAKSYETAHKKGIPCICYNIKEMNIYIIGLRNKQILMYENESCLTLPQITVTKNGSIKENGNHTIENIYKEIIDKYKEITNSDIHLCEFISPENKYDTKHFVIGHISSDENINDNCQWKDVYNNKGVCTLFSSLDIKDSYLCRLQNLLRCYGIYKD